MFEYLSADIKEKLYQLDLESFVAQFCSEKKTDVKKLYDLIQTEIENNALEANFWQDLTLHFFHLPQPYYLGSEASFFYFYSVKNEIAKFQSLKSMKEKQGFIEQTLENYDDRYLAICFSLSLIEEYQAAGHLMCVSTYENILKQCPPAEKNLYAVQIYFHALMLKKEFKYSKPIFRKLGWKESFEQSYTSPKRFIALMFAAVRPHLCERSKNLAENLASNTHPRRITSLRS